MYVNLSLSNNWTFTLLTTSLARPQGSPYSLLRVLLGPGSAMAGCMSAIAPEASVGCACVKVHVLIKVHTCTCVLVTLPECLHEVHLHIMRVCINLFAHWALCKKKTGAFCYPATY